MLSLQHQKGVIRAVQSLFSNGVRQTRVMLAADNLKRIAEQDVMLDAPVIIAMGINNEIGLKLTKLAFGIVYRNVAQQKLRITRPDGLVNNRHH